MKNISSDLSLASLSCPFNDGSHSKKYGVLERRFKVSNVLFTKQRLFFFFFLDEKNVRCFCSAKAHTVQKLITSYFSKKILA